METPTKVQCEHVCKSNDFLEKLPFGNSLTKEMAKFFFEDMVWVGGLLKVFFFSKKKPDRINSHRRHFRTRRSGYLYDVFMISIEANAVLFQESFEWDFGCFLSANRCFKVMDRKKFSIIILSFLWLSIIQGEDVCTSTECIHASAMFLERSD